VGLLGVKTPLQSNHPKECHGIMKKIILLLVITAHASLLARESPYAGLEVRDIKALSKQEISQYLAGDGMGLALPAELNGYPGPRHVLELAEELELSAERQQAVQEVHHRMHAEAVRLGRLIIEGEGVLDDLFASQSVSTEKLKTALEKLGRLQTDLRFAHLEAHLRVKHLLTEEQLLKYAVLRGYAHGGPDRSHHQDHG
jgi:Spy/CpxP family protein refolding chaperone